ncbi:MAG: DsbA family protein [Alphaproteobacteria bacterium]
MNKYIAPLLLLASFTSPYAVAELSAADKEEVKQVINEYLLDNPEILFEMQNALQIKEDKAQQAFLQDALDKVYQDDNTPAIGNTENPKLTVTEFMDYSCGYCKLMWPHLEQLAKDYPDLRIKIVNIPILGHYSGQTAAYSLAFWRLYPQKWQSFHGELMQAKGEMSNDAFKKLAKSLDANWDEIAKLAQGEDVTMEINRNLQMFNGAGIQGTPFYVVGKDDILRGAVGYENMKEAIDTHLKQQ